jgi:hypothetical protein
MSDNMDTNAELLRIALATAVPFWIMRVRNRPHYRQERASQCAAIIAEKGDIILYKSKKKGETAKAFNALAEALAIGAFVPGGISFAGLTWEEKDSS